MKAINLLIKTLLDLKNKKQTVYDYNTNRISFIESLGNDNTLIKKDLKF
jgi:hypothetical protein